MALKVEAPALTAASNLVHGVPPVAMSRISTRVNKTGSWKYIRPIYRDRVAPCNEACPVGIDIEGYMNLLRQDRVEEARELLLRENPLPGITGRVCYRPCESSCNRAQLDGAVSIRSVERSLGDEADAEPLSDPLVPKRAETVAVVGSGPAGLACAFHLVRLGYAVTIYEADPEPGGVLRYGIPAYRLPRGVLAREIERIRALGVEFRCGERLGRDREWSELDRYDAVFLGVGAQKDRAMGIDGEHAAGVRSGLDFLREVAVGGRPEIGPTVIVVGGGNTAMDCARTARRLGSEPIVMYRRTRAEMPAIEEEIAQAEREGIRFQMLASPTRVHAEGGRLVGLECVSMRLGEADASGRRRPLPVKGGHFYIMADSLLIAIGEEPEATSVPGHLKREGDLVEVDGFGQTSRARWFAGGDVVDEPRTVAHALGAGKRAAIGIDRSLRDGSPLGADERDALRLGPLGNVSMTRWRGDDPVVRHDEVNEVVRFEELNEEYFEPVARHPDRELAPDAVCVPPSAREAPWL